MNAIKSCNFTLATLVMIAGLLSSCTDKPAVQETQSSWDQLKSDAKATYADAVEVSKEKWGELKSFSSDEWQEAGQSMVELKDKVVATGKDAQPKVEQMLHEAEVLRQEAASQLKAFQEASGEKADASREKLEKTWKQLQDKMQAVRDAIADEE